MMVIECRLLENVQPKIPRFDFHLSSITVKVYSCGDTLYIMTLIIIGILFFSATKFWATMWRSKQTLLLVFQALLLPFQAISQGENRQLWEKSRTKFSNHSCLIWWNSKEPLGELLVILKITMILPLWPFYCDLWLFNYCFSNNYSKLLKKRLWILCCFCFVVFLLGKWPKI